MPSPHRGGAITPTGISSPAPGVPQRMQACPSAWARVISRLPAAWQAIITMKLRVLAAGTVLTVQLASDAAGRLPRLRHLALGLRGGKSGCQGGCREGIG